MRQVLLGPTIAIFLLSANFSVVQADEKGVDELAVEGLSKLMDALSLFVDAIPQYSAPEILENGDIIIRRKNKDKGDEDDEKESPDVEETSA